MLVPCSGYLVAAPGLLVLAWSGALIPSLVGLSLYGIARGFFDANRMPIVRQLVDERYSATAYGFLNLVGCITGGVMTYVGGSLRDAKLSLSIAFVICAVAILITSGRCFMLKPTGHLSAMSGIPQRQSLVTLTTAHLRAESEHSPFALRIVLVESQEGTWQATGNGPACDSKRRVAAVTAGCSCCTASNTSAPSPAPRCKNSFTLTTLNHENRSPRWLHPESRRQSLG